MVADNLARDTKPWYQMLQIQGCDTFSGDIRGARDELRGLGASVVDNREYGVETVRLR